MLQHQQAEGAERQAKDEHEGKKIRTKKSFRPFESAYRAKHDANHSSDERALLHAADGLRRSVLRHGHSGFPPGVCSLFSWGGGDTFLRKSAGRSETLALRLSCSGRQEATMGPRSLCGIFG